MSPLRAPLAAARDRGPGCLAAARRRRRSRIRPWSGSTTSMSGSGASSAWSTTRACCSCRSGSMGSMRSCARCAARSRNCRTATTCCASSSAICTRILIGGSGRIAGRCRSSGAGGTDRRHGRRRVGAGGRQRRGRSGGLPARLRCAQDHRLQRARSRSSRSSCAPIRRASSLAMRSTGWARRYYVNARLRQCRELRFARSASNIRSRARLPMRC